MTNPNIHIKKSIVAVLMILSCFSSRAADHFKMKIYETSCDTLSAWQINPEQLIQEGAMVCTKNKLPILNPDKVYWLYLKAYAWSDAHILSFGKNISKAQVYSYPFRTPTQKAGARVAYAHKKLPGSDVFISGQDTTYLIRVENKMYSKIFPEDITLIPVHEYYRSQQRKGLWHGMVQGSFWLMILFNTILFVTHRKKIYLYYVLFVFCNSLYLLYAFGYSEKLLFWQSATLNHLLLSFQLAGLIFYCLFLRVVFLEHCPSFNKKLDKILIIPYCMILSLIILLMAVSTFTHMAFFVQWIAMVNMISGMVAIGCFVLYFKNSYVFARYIATGSIIMITGGTITVCLDLFYQPSAIWPYQGGLMIELILFSYALNQLYISELNKRNELEISRLKLKNELSEKNRELVQKVMQISAQAETLSRVKSVIGQQNTQELQNQSLSLIPNPIHAKQEKNLWREFEMYFHKTHPEFYNALLNSYPDLTQNELKLCAFIMLNLNTKEIATITQRTPHSIEAMRSRIRKKMNLSRNANLYHSISRIGFNIDSRQTEEKL